jgi:RNA polymerase sigma factor (sigma-70 family)
MEKVSKSTAIAENIDWREVYDNLLPRVFHYFFYKVGDQFLAEELTAITFEKAWTSRKRYKRDLGAFQFWLFGIAQKVAVDNFRNHKNEIPLDSVNPLSSQKVESEIEAKADTERLISILKILSERERSLISLKYGAELNNREIARQTGLSESSVGTILYRAVTRLRKEWEQIDGR